MVSEALCRPSLRLSATNEGCWAKTMIFHQLLCLNSSAGWFRPLEPKLQVTAARPGIWPTGVEPRGQAAAIIESRGAFDGLGLGGIRMDDRTQLAQAHSCHHGQRDLADHFPGVPGDDGRPQDLVGPGFDQNFGEAFGLAVQDGAVHLAERLEVNLDGEALLLGCRLIQPHVGHFRIGVSAPGDGQGA